MSATPNPYAPPKANVEDIVPATSEAEAIRREHIKHEASVRSVGMLYYISGTLVFLVGVAMLVASLTRTAEQSFLLTLLGIFYLLLGGFSIYVARGLRKLLPWARTACIVLSVIGLLGFPIGTLISGYILYLMLAKKGKRIFESDYLGIVAATPDVKYRTSIIVWIFLGLLLLVVLLAIVLAVMRPS